MKISLIGCGEVGRCYAEALAAAGHRMVDLCDERPTDALRVLAESLGARVQTAPGDWLADADVVISAVFGGVALDVAHRALPLMTPGAIYADFTTANPAHMATAAAEAATHNVRLVDVAITGGISMTRHKTPLLCAGIGAEDIRALLASVGAPIKAVGDRAGDAATLKLLRSIFTKGVEALAVECLVAAEKKDLRHTLYDVLSDVDQTPLPTFLEACVRTHVLHAKRRLAEVQEAKRQLRLDDLEPLVLDGVEALFQRTTNALTAETAPIDNTIEGSLTWLRQHAESPRPPA
ncbi:NAD(P)-binding domain-containing protein [Alcaligenaceae bacterium B3P038]|nr:NAD(P)-binding domain-containing protein [Alcaligenaceae bacterium B3P038]